MCSIKSTIPGGIKVLKGAVFIRVKASWCKTVLNKSCYLNTNATLNRVNIIYCKTFPSIVFIFRRKMRKKSEAGLGKLFKNTSTRTVF